jgi:hypothetical protein
MKFDPVTQEFSSTSKVTLFNVPVNAIPAQNNFEDEGAVFFIKSFEHLLFLFSTSDSANGRAAANSRYEIKTRCRF